MAVTGQHLDLLEANVGWALITGGEAAGPPALLAHTPLHGAA